MVRLQTILFLGHGSFQTRNICVLSQTMTRIFCRSLMILLTFCPNASTFHTQFTSRRISRLFFTSRACREREIYFRILNGQLVCNANQRVMNVHSSLPDSCHDSYFLHRPPLDQKFIQISYGWLVGEVHFWGLS